MRHLWLLFPILAPLPQQGKAQGVEAEVRVLKEEHKRLEEKIDANHEAILQLREDMNRRFEGVDRWFEQIDRRFEQIDQRFGQIDQRLGQMVTLMIGIVGAFAAIVAVTIGFALWDRRTFLKPVEMRVEE